MPDLYTAYAQINEFADRWMTLHNVPGLTMSITDRNETLQIISLGLANAESGEPMQPGTLFEAGSIGKSLTALCLLRLRDAGAVDLHRPVTDYLPWFRVNTDHEPITVHHLLTHTSGITRGGDYAPYGMYEVWALRGATTGGPPGRRFNYSNVGYKALGHLLEEVTGTGYAELIQAELLDPLGMSESHPVATFATKDLMAQGYWPRYDDRPAPPGNPVAPAGWHEYGSGDGSLASNASDMAAYVRLFLNRGTADGNAIVSAAGFDAMVQKYIAVGYLPNTWYGYGLNVSERGGFTHVDHGGLMLGYHATVMADLDNGIGAAVLNNGTLEPTEVAEFALSAMRAALAGEPLPALDPEVAPDRVRNTSDYAGAYRSGDRRFTLTDEGGRLTLTSESGQALLHGRGRDRFYVDHPDYRLHLLTFMRQEGRVVEAFHGADWYTNADYSGPADFDAPEEWNAYTGHYRSHNPWYTNFRVFVRKGRLTLAMPGTPGSRLADAGDGSFRVGSDPESPERVRFGAVVNGKAIRANLYNFDYYRTFTP